MPELYLPKASDVISAYEAGDQQRQQRQMRVARQQGGAQLAAGDYGAAAGTLYGAGDLSGGAAATNMGRQHETDLANLDEQKREKLQSDLKMTYQVLRGVQTQEDLDGLKADPRVASMLPSIAGLDLPKAQQVVHNLKGVFPEESVVVGDALIGRESGDVRYQAEKPYKPDWKQRTAADGSSEWFDINAEAGAGPQAAPQAPSSPGGGDWLDGVASAAPDAQVTSGYRDPAKNARVGGKANSRHLTGEAVDLVPRPGETMAQLHARVSRVPGVRAINEGDHEHVQKTGPRVAPRRSVPGDAPKPKEVWVELPDGRQRNTVTGKIEGTVKGAGDTKSTEAERTAGFLASRLADSLSNLTSISSTSPSAGKPGLTETVAGVFGAEAANASRGAERQQVVANQLDILDAALTLGTGAAYTPDQLRNYRDTYFPKLTDKPETVTAKGQKLLALLRAAKIKAGNAAPPALDAAIRGAEQRFAGGAEQPSPGAGPKVRRYNPATGRLE